MAQDLTFLDATKLAELIRTREISSVEVVSEHLDRIRAVDPKVNAIVTLADGALEAARQADADVKAGEGLHRHRRRAHAAGLAHLQGSQARG